MRGRWKYKKGYGLPHPPVSTGRVANIMGLSDEGVRLYEKYGLVYPEKGEPSGYRSFDTMDIAMLLYGRIYRESGFSSREAARIANECTPDEAASAYREESLRIRQEAALALKKAERLEEAARDIALLSGPLGEWETVQSPGLYRLEVLSKFGLTQDAGRQSRMRRWMEKCAPFVMLSTRYFHNMIHPSIPLGERVSEDVSASGPGIFEKYATLFSIEKDAFVRYEPPVRAAHALLYSDNDLLFPDFSTLFPFLRQSGLKIAGDAVTFGIANLSFDGKFERYFHVWIPVEEDDAASGG